MDELRDGVAVITGGASGIGLAMARRFAREGMRLVLADVDATALTQAVDRLVVDGLVADGIEVVGQPTDVTDPAALTALADLAYERFGAVHVLCNNAGVFAGGLLWERPAADFDWVMGVNVDGILNGVRAFVPRMLAGGHEGHIVNTASSAGLFGSPYTGPYTVSKFAAFAISECLAWDLSSVGAPIGVSVVCPGAIATAIGRSDRNRPAHLAADRSVDATLVEDALRDQTASGQSPDVVADVVVDAIRTGRFLVLTGPAYEDALRGRTEALLDGKLPPLIAFD